MTSAEAPPECYAALFDVYCDIAEQCMATGVMSYMKGLTDRMAELLSDIDDGGRSRRRYETLLKAQQPYGSEVAAASALSRRAGHESEAYDAVRRIGVPLHQLGRPLHEDVGWIIYRYMNAGTDRLTSVQIRGLLRDYLLLENPRPSALHSAVLRIAAKFARTAPEFNFCKFFMMWQPRYITADDAVTADIGDRRVPSLLSLVVETMLDSDAVSELPGLLGLVKLPPAVIMEVIREGFFRKIIGYYRSGDLDTALDFIDIYIAHCSLHAASEWHSRILSVALKLLRGEQSGQLPEFLVAWDSDYFRDEDFVADIPAARPLAVRALKHCFDAVRLDVARYQPLLPKLIDMFAAVAARVTDNEWIYRKRALMLAWSGHAGMAIGEFRRMAVAGVGSFYFWLDFSEAVEDRDVKIGLLSKAMLAADECQATAGRLTMAQLLHFAGLDDRAAVELDAYASQCAEPSARYRAVRATLGDAEPGYTDNRTFYLQASARADEFVYADVPTAAMSVIRVSGSALTMTDGRGTVLGIDAGLLPPGAPVETGSNLALKFLARDGEPLRVLSVTVAGGDAYGALPLRVGYAAGIGPDGAALVYCGSNAEPVEVHGVPEGAYVRFRSYTDDGGRRQGVAPVVIDAPAAWRHFRHRTMAVWAVDRRRGVALLSVAPGMPGCEAPLSMTGDVVAAGSLLDVTYYVIPGTGGSHTLVPLVCRVTEDDVTVPVVKRVSGELKLSSDGVAGFVRCVSVDAELMQSAGVEAGMYVSACSVLVPRTADGPEHWRAVSLTPYV